jgi:hypothetical protein
MDNTLLIDTQMITASFFSFKLFFNRENFERHESICIGHIRKTWDSEIILQISHRVEKKQQCYSASASQATETATTATFRSVLPEHHDECSPYDVKGLLILLWHKPLSPGDCYQWFWLTHLLPRVK